MKINNFWNRNHSIWNVRWGVGEKNYNDTIVQCNKNVFEVKNWTYNTGEKSLWTWEKGLTDIELTVGSCVDKNDEKECEIKISEGVGLEWKPEFTPIAIF